MLVSVSTAKNPFVEDKTLKSLRMEISGMAKIIGQLRCFTYDGVRY